MICDPAWANRHEAHRVSTNQILLTFSFSYWECPLAVRRVLFVWICQLVGLCSTLSVSSRLFTGICLWVLHQQRTFLHHSFFVCLGCFIEQVRSISLRGGEFVSPSYPEGGKQPWKVKDAICFGIWELLPPWCLGCMEAPKLASTQPFFQSRQESRVILVPREA